MRSPARLSPALLGLALVLPATSLADSTAAPKHHKGLFRSCKCVECQRARVKARDGVDVPAPPPVPPNIVAVGDGRGKLARRFGRGGAEYCEACENGVVVGAPVMMAGEAPGYAVVGEPSPIGTVTGPAANRGGMAARRGQKDPSVAVTEFAAATTPIGGPGHNRPHVLSHAFNLDMIGRRSGEERERRRREKHASIAYGPQNTAPVTELPASVVYRRSR